MGRTIVLCGPSASGKTTVANVLKNKLNCKKTISCTTKTPRADEVDGKDYYFLTREAFDTLIKEDKFFEYTTYAGNLYGTLKSEVEGEDNVVMVLDFYGARFCQSQGAEVYYIYRDKADLVSSILDRDCDKSEKVDRIIQLGGELKQMELFKNIIFNDTVENTVNKILKKEKQTK